MMKYNLYNVFYSILDLILLKLTTAEIKLMVSGEYGFDPFEFIFLYGMRKYSQMKTDSTFFFFTSASAIFFLDMPPQERETKAKIQEMGLHQTKNFCTAKETINKTKRLPAEWEKIFASEISGKGLISKIYKECIELNIKNTKSSVKKWAEDLNQELVYFSKEDIQMANRHIKRWSNH